MKSVLSGKNAFITGASGGLGKEIAESLASLGANLFLVAGSSTSDVENLSSSLSKKYSNQTNPISKTKLPYKIQI